MKRVVTFATRSYTLPNTFDEGKYVKSTEEEILTKHFMLPAAFQDPSVC